VPGLTVASYNIHGCIGGDRRHAPARIAAVIEELGADLVGLQEVDTYDDPEPFDQLEYLGRVLRMQAIPGPTFLRGGRPYGNAILTRRPVRAIRRIELSVPQREPRGALDVDLDLGGGREARVLVTHLGLAPRERHEQVRILTRVFAEERGGLMILLGDFNGWVPVIGPVARLDRALGGPRWLRTFPARLPLLPLDRIWVQPHAALRELRVHRTELSRVASDHLPVTAIIETDSVGFFAARHYTDPGEPEGT
jgi:endonuclease/exonuclease/phosphatase family metal-dependent hydrolase